MENLSPKLFATDLSPGGGQREECYFWLGTIIESFSDRVTYEFEGQSRFG